MAIQFLQQYIDHAFSIGQCVCYTNNWIFLKKIFFLKLPFQFMDKKTLTVAVKDIEGIKQTK